MALALAVSNSSENCIFKVINVAESLAIPFGCLERFPCRFDVIEFECVFWQPFGSEPVIAFFQRLTGHLVNSPETHGAAPSAGLTADDLASAQKTPVFT